MIGNFITKDGLLNPSENFNYAITEDGGTYYASLISSYSKSGDFLIPYYTSERTEVDSSLIYFVNPKIVMSLYVNGKYVYEHTYDMPIDKYGRISLLDIRLIFESELRDLYQKLMHVAMLFGHFDVNKIPDGFGILVTFPGMPYLDI